MEEYELKFLDVKIPILEKLLVSLGAQRVGEYDYHRVIMEDPEGEMKKKHSWIRLRTDGKETTLTYKQSIKEGEKNIGMKEIEVGVEDYEKTLELMKALGFSVWLEEKNKRLRYIKGDVVFDIDSWPGIPTYLEIESDSYEKVKQAASELGFDPEKGILGTAGSVYKHYGINIDDYSMISFEKMVKR